jgi:hypothetical protein
VILLAPGALAGAALFILAKQLRYSLEPSFEWPTYFDKVHVLGWIGVSTLVADLVIREVRSRSKAEAVEKVEDERHDEVSLGEGGDVVQPVEHVEGHV